MKPLISSKRFWTGIIALVTGLSLLLTGEKPLAEQLPVMMMTAISLIQTIVAILSGNEILEVGGKAIGGTK